MVEFGWCGPRPNSTHCASTPMRYPARQSRSRLRRCESRARQSANRGCAVNLSQPKVDLAVLYKLHRHADLGGGPITPEGVMRLFNVHVPFRRVELALEELQGRREVEREYQPLYGEEGLWEISRGGLARVDRALKVPASFIARLHAGGDEWLESDEAAQAILKKLQAGPTKSPEPLRHSIHEPTPTTWINWTMWSALAGIIAIPIAVILWYFA